MSNLGAGLKTQQWGKFDYPYVLELFLMSS